MDTPGWTIEEMGVKGCLDKVKGKGNGRKGRRKYRTREGKEWRICQVLCV